MDDGGRNRNAVRLHASHPRVWKRHARCHDLAGGEWSTRGCTGPRAGRHATRREICRKGAALRQTCWGDAAAADNPGTSGPQRAVQRYGKAGTREALTAPGRHRARPCLEERRALQPQPATGPGQIGCGGSAPAIHGSGHGKTLAHLARQLALQLTRTIDVRGAGADARCRGRCALQTSPVEGFEAAGCSPLQVGPRQFHAAGVRPAGTEPTPVGAGQGCTLRIGAKGFSTPRFGVGQ